MSPTRICPVAAIFAAAALAGTAPGIGNFERVDDHVLRGAQPTAEGILYLSKIGVKRVLDLRGEGGRGKMEEKQVTAAGMKYIRIPMSGKNPPTAEQIVKALDLLQDAADGPIFVHCMRGADRTGTVIAAYHIEHDRWDNTKALQDAKAHGMSPFQMPRMRYIRAYKARPNQVDGAAPATSGK
jgi:tyrosine-protein phosphatase SIW14